MENIISMENIKRIPYGISNFTAVMEQNQYYVDKTMYIPLLEQQPSNLIFIRPRRFGKSLFISMLRSYYNIAYKEKFDQWFGRLWIGKNPTPNRNRYQVLFLDFSRIGNSMNELERNFDEYCCDTLDLFASVYARWYAPGFAEEMKAKKGATRKLNYLDMQAKERGIPLYLFIDEYDNFTNGVLNEQGEAVYNALTHASGFYREAFKKYKGMFERIFITGVSPVTLDDLTSGFNIGWNISTQPEFNGMLGFSEVDVREMFRYYQEAGQLKGDIDQMIEEMKPWYNNYCFAEESLKSDPKMFNSDMVLYYLRHYMNRGESPKQMVDPNTRTDYTKMKRLINLDKLDGDRKGLLHKITEEGQIVTDLVLSFPAEKIMRPENFVSLLFYYGMLTITGTRGNRLILGIPNNNVRKQYYEYALEEYQNQQELKFSDLRNLYDSMAFDGDWKPALTFIAEAYRNNSSVRSAMQGERNIQGFFTAYLSINSYYLTAPEVETNHGYCDLFLMPDRIRYPETRHSYIIELKYLTKEKSEEQAEAQWQEAAEQVRRYAQGEKVQRMCEGTDLHCVVMQFRGWELERMEEVD